MRASLAAVAVLAIAASPARAQDPVRLEDLVVTASRAPVDSAALPVAVTVLRGTDLRARGLRFLADVLPDLTSMATAANGSWGSVTSGFLRGGESDYVRVLVDGVPLNAPGGFVDFGAVALDDIERIEVVRGPASVVHGSDAVSGVIQLFTRDGAGSTSTEAGGGAVLGGGASRAADAWLRTGGDGWSAAATAGWTATDGTYDFNSAFDRTVLGGRLQVAPAAQTVLTAGARYTDHTSAFPTDFTGTPLDSNQANTGRATQLDLRAEQGLGRLAATVTAGWRSATAGYRNDPDSPGDTVGFAYAARRQTETSRLLLDGRLGTQVAAGRLAVVGGVTLDREAEAQRGRSTSNFGDGAFESEDQPFDEHRTTLGWYGEGTWTPAAPVLLQAGLRLDDSDAFGSFVTWRAGGSVRVARGTRVMGSAGTAFKAPSLAETYADSPFERGNPDLDPERSLSWEVGVEQELASGDLVVEARWFDQRFRDLIQYFAAAETGPTYFNLAEAAARGLELTARARLGRVVQARATLTHLDTEVVDGGPTEGGGTFATGERLLRRPGFQASVGGDVQLDGGLAFGIVARHIGARDDLDFATFPSTRVTLAAVTVTDVTAGWSPLRDRDLVLTARVENLFDAAYETAAGYPGRGRVAFVGVRVGR